MPGSPRRGHRGLVPKGLSSGCPLAPVPIARPAASDLTRSWPGTKCLSPGGRVFIRLRSCSILHGIVFWQKPLKKSQCRGKKIKPIKSKTVTSADPGRCQPALRWPQQRLLTATGTAGRLVTGTARSPPPGGDSLPRCVPPTRRPSGTRNSPQPWLSGSRHPPRRSKGRSQLISSIHRSLPPPRSPTLACDTPSSMPRPAPSLLPRHLPTSRRGCASGLNPRTPVHTCFLLGPMTREPAANGPGLPSPVTSPPRGEPRLRVWLPSGVTSFASPQLQPREVERQNQDLNLGRPQSLRQP